MFNSAKTIAELQGRITSLEADLTAANASAVEAANQIAALTTEKTTALADLAQAKADHEAALAAKEAEIEARVQQGIIDGLASAGIPESQLPAKKTGPAANDFEAQIADLNAQIEASKDPLEKGKLASKVIDLMGKHAAAAAA